MFKKESEKKLKVQKNKTTCGYIVNKIFLNELSSIYLDYLIFNVSSLYTTYHLQK